MKPTVPMTKALNMLDRYHSLRSTVVFSSWLSATSELVEDDMFGADENGVNNGIEQVSTATYILILILYGILLGYICIRKFTRLWL
jgi:hypothetical protein